MIERILDVTLPTLAENLALDEALLIEVDRGARPAILRLWDWPRLAVVMGASGRVNEEVHRAACEADGIELARRASGGGTVLQGPGVVNVAVVLPMDAAPGLGFVETAQAFVLERIAGALSELGPGVEVRGSGDLTIDGRKCAGSAQRRLKRTFLVHTSILYNFSLPLMERYLTEPRRRPAYREGRTHAEFVANLPLTRAEITRAVVRAWAGEAIAVETGPVPAEIVAGLVEEKYGRRDWIERF